MKRTCSMQLQHSMTERANWFDGMEADLKEQNCATDRSRS
jgi:hypothetical protein